MHEHAGIIIVIALKLAYINGPFFANYWHS